MTQAAVSQLIHDDVKRLNTLIETHLQSDVVLINQIAYYIINSGGKRLRPQLCLLSAHATGYQGDQHVIQAAVIEFIHTATLLHDDVVDESAKRRGQDTANEIWGNASSVLVGDFLYSRAFQLMVKAQNLTILEMLSNTTNCIAEGEVLQLLNIQNPDITLSAYEEIIYRKTACLFETACAIGGLLSNRSETVVSALKQYGKHLGIIFQVMDDLLDYTADETVLGKRLGDDLAEGKTTLPLIYAIQQASQSDQQFLKQAIKDANRANINDVNRIIQQCGAIEQTYAFAQQHIQMAESALKVLPQNAYTDVLCDLLKTALKRTK